jgi:hypothetical protein
MKRLLPILPVLVLILSGCQTIPDKYTTFKGMPCNFHGATVGTNNFNFNATLGSLSKRCCPTCKGYKGKRGQSINVGRGTPVYAVADMELVDIENRSAIKNCRVMNRSQVKAGVGAGNCQTPFDDLELGFKDKLGNTILYYHLMSENPFVPGFGKGNCKIPTLFGTNRQRRMHGNCGGKVKTKVKKGELVGFSGATGMEKGGQHFSFAIRITNHPDFPKQQGWIVPANSLTWENAPSENDEVYLLPLKTPSLSKKDRSKVDLTVVDHNPPPPKLAPPPYCWNKEQSNIYENTTGCKSGDIAISRLRYKSLTSKIK